MKHMCPCCGYVGLQAQPYANLPPLRLIRGSKPPYEIKWGLPSYEVCPCCGFEFGNDDNPGTAEPISFEEYLDEWIRNGQRWFDLKRRPPDWNLEHQLAQSGRQSALQFDGAAIESLSSTTDLKSPLLIEAISIWTGWGREVSPRRNDSALKNRFGEKIASDLLPIIRSIVGEFYASDANIVAADLVAMGKMAANDFKMKHPDVADEILEALTWCYTFDFK